MDSNLFRPGEARQLVGDASKARKELDWQPKTQFEELVREMIDADCRLLNSKL
jgi:GDPmannose 4,6-dehydratase